MTIERKGKKRIIISATIDGARHTSEYFGFSLAEAKESFKIEYEVFYKRESKQA